MNARDGREREDLGNEIAALMAPLIRAMRVSLRSCAEAQELAPGEANALWLLATAGEITTKDLAGRLDIDPANASTLLTRLERRGLVRRDPATYDRRKRVVSLTESGRETRLALARCIGDRQPAFRNLSTEDLATLRDVLQRLAPAT
jgi:DNA-binding MarR family transcriptional regulator